MTLPSPSELRALAGEATEGKWEVVHDRIKVGEQTVADVWRPERDARLIALAPTLARRVADLEEWAELARDYIEATGRYLSDDPAPASAQAAALLARLDEIRGQA